jgi:hypothetical protein
MNLRVSFLLVLSLLLCIAGRSAMAAAGPDLVRQGGKVYPSPTIRGGKVIYSSQGKVQ